MYFPLWSSNFGYDFTTASLCPGAGNDDSFPFAVLEIVNVGLIKYSGRKLGSLVTIREKTIRKRGKLEEKKEHSFC